MLRFLKRKASEIDEDEEVEHDMDYPESTKQKEEADALLYYLLSHPSVNEELKKSFLVFWEMLPLGNYTERDIAILRNEFEQYIILMLMEIPDDEWGASFKVAGEEFTLSHMIELLRICFYVQLTRGRLGFTMKEMGTVRAVRKVEKDEWKL